MERVLGWSLRYYVKGAEAPLAMKELPLAFGRAGVEMQDIGKYFFPRLIPILEKHVAAQFAAQGKGPNRGKWEPLSPAYRKQKAKLYPGAPILVRKGHLRDGLTKAASRFAQRVYTGKQLNYGTQAVPYGSFHQTGTEEGLASASRRKFTNMPDRPPFDVGADFARELKGAAIESVRDVVKASRLDRFAQTTEGTTT